MSSPNHAGQAGQEGQAGRTDPAERPLEEWVEGWRPRPVRRTEQLAADPAAALAAVLDQPAPVREPGDPLPALWQCLYFLDRTPHSGLAADGHPWDDGLVPPIPRRRRMVAGGRLEVVAPLRVGDRVVRDSEVAGVRHTTGRSGELLFVTVRHRFSVDGQPRLEEHQDMVYRQRPTTTRPTAGQASEPPAEAEGRSERPVVPEQVAAEWTLTLHPDAALLFRFSALTFNAHRIHYDHPYTTSVEGYPGLVVHGPLIALGMLEPPRRAGVSARRVRYRFHRPVFCDQPVVFGGRRTGSGTADLTASAGSGYLAATAHVELAERPADG